MSAEQPTTVVHVTDDSQIGAARRAAAGIAETLEFSETAAGKVALLATELATNLVRHGGGGELLVGQRPVGIIELVAIDRGPGMASIERAIRDGYSTGGTSGTGLGAIRRMADAWDLFSAPGAGTAVVARVIGRHGADALPPRGRLRAAAVSVAAPGESVCGDAWASSFQEDRWRILVVDGLGHGPLAARAAAEAVQVFEEHPRAELAQLLDLSHRALRPTRGAALAIAEVVPSRASLTFAGIGNIAGVILTNGGSRSLVSQPGIVGHECRRIQTFSYEWTEEAVLVMHSDGLQSRWTLDRYPALVRHDPALLAAVLYRDYARGRDDVTVVCARRDGPA